MGVVPSATALCPLNRIVNIIRGIVASSTVATTRLAFGERVGTEDECEEDHDLQDGELDHGVKGQLGMGN